MIFGRFGVDFDVIWATFGYSSECLSHDWARWREGRRQVDNLREFGRTAVILTTGAENVGSGPWAARHFGKQQI